MRPQCLLSSFSSIRHSVWEKMSFKEFQMAARQPSWILEWNDDSNSGSPCCPNAYYQVSAQFNFLFGRRNCLKKSWISVHNNFSNPETPCHPKASHQFSAQSGFCFGRRCRLRIPRWPPRSLRSKIFAFQDLCVPISGRPS